MHTQINLSILLSDKAGKAADGLDERSGFVLFFWKITSLFGFAISADSPKWRKPDTADDAAVWGASIRISFLQQVGSCTGKAARSMNTSTQVLGGGFEKINRVRTLQKRLVVLMHILEDFGGKEKKV